MNAGWRAKALGTWLILEPLPLWASVTVPLIGLAMGWAIPVEPELRVRLAGYLVTLAGVGLVVKGIRDKRRHFGRPALFERLRNWLSRLPALLGGPRPVTGKAMMAAGAIFATGSGHVRLAVSSSAPLEERLAALEENLKRIDDRITGVDGQLRGSITELREAIRVESSAREQLHQSLKMQLESLSAGGLDFEAVGVVWVVVGNAFSTFPTELAKAIARVL
jgi:hypothetical protein